MDDTTSWTHLGEFTRGIGMGAHIRFLVERSLTDHAVHRIRCDEDLGNGPYLVAVFTEPAADPTVWRPAWAGDRMSPGIETEARAIARGRLPEVGPSQGKTGPAPQFGWRCGPVPVSFRS
ncbi:hypothetical protein LO763_07940 [Glycomyces sp. A-F 0318]|uniref:hypothetical protein n=1 Tax=Glycomyces amatae TaxID=2881355 RepID=UPI001E2D216C|nr:hypothetical protein [Glycomyces amatae]MCD0443558.1 hypothetical protein [Glycomyces amatae]